LEEIIAEHEEIAAAISFNWSFGAGVIKARDVTNTTTLAKTMTRKMRSMNR